VNSTGYYMNRAGGDRVIKDEAAGPSVMPSRV